MLVHVKTGIFIAVGIVLIIGSIILQSQFHNIFGILLTKKLLLQPGSPTLESFKDPPVPVYMQYYFFNVTNKNEIMKHGSKPILQQVGPYTYSEKMLKYDIEFDEDAGTISFLQNKSFYFRHDLSQGLKESDLITTINSVMISVASKFDTLPSATKSILELWFLRYHVEPFVTKPVGEMLFRGYDDPFLKKIGSLTKDPVHLTGKFGFYYPKNNTNGGRYVIKSGVQGMEDYQNIVTWKGETKLDFWKEDLFGGDTCNMINGTSGNQFPRYPPKDKPLQIFTAELCRSIYLLYQKDVQHGPLTLRRFIIPDELLADKPENECYCHDDFTCRPSMINVAKCRKGAPVIMSTPHFYQGDPKDLTYVEGLNPQESEHETYIDIEPNTGVTFRAAKRIQANMPLRQYSNIPAFKNVPNVIMPIFWVNESAVVPMTRTKALHRTLNLPFKVVKVVTSVLIALGVILALIGIVNLALLLRHRTLLKNSPTRENKTNMEREMERHKLILTKLNSENYK